MMRHPAKTCHAVLLAAAAWFVCATAHAASDTSTPDVPMLLAKSWALGYALVGLGILLGMLAVLIPSMRKSLRKKDG